MSVWRVWCRSGKQKTTGRSNWAWCYKKIQLIRTQKIFNIQWNYLVVRWLEKSCEKAVFTKHIKDLLKFQASFEQVKICGQHLLLLTVVFPLISCYHNLFLMTYLKNQASNCIFLQEWLSFSSFHLFKIQTNICKTWTLHLCNRFNIFSKANYEK